MFDFSTVDYTDKDYIALSERLRELIKSVKPNWLDDDIIAFGNLMLDAFAFVGDVINKYNDNNLKEAFVPTANLLSSFIKMAVGVGTRIPLQSASTVDQLFSIEAARSENVLISQGTVVYTKGESPISFQTLADGTIVAGTTSVSIVVENSENIEQLITPGGTAWWSTWLDRNPFLEIISIVDTGGSNWTEISTFVDSEPADRHFKIDVNSSGNAKISFGDGVLGRVPTEDLTVQYKIGGGTNGQLASDTLDQLDGSFEDATGNEVTVSTNNPAQSSGGTNRMTPDEARRFVPAAIRTRTNTISNQDFVDNALEVTSVARALMLTVNEDAGIEDNAGHLIVIPEGGGLPSQALKDAVYAKVTTEKPSTITFRTYMHDPSYLEVNINCVVYRNSGNSKADTRTALETDLGLFFQIKNSDGSINTNIDFGGGRKDVNGNTDSTLPWSDLENVIYDNSTVRKTGQMLVNGIASDLSLQTREFPILGTLTLVDGDDGLIF
jgi:hypothetical protein